MRLNSIDATKLDPISIAQHESVFERRAGNEVEKETVFPRVASSGRLRAAIPVSRTQRKILIQIEVDPDACLFFIHIRNVLSKLQRSHAQYRGSLAQLDRDVDFRPELPIRTRRGCLLRFGRKRTAEPYQKA